MAELANCSNCDAVFVKNIRPVCRECFEAEEKAFEIVYRFLTKRINREATIEETVEETGVEEKVIIKFIRENRLRTSQFPKLAYPCEKCSANIVSGRLCQTCSSEILNELENQAKMEERQNKRLEDQKKSHVYYSIDND